MPSPAEQGRLSSRDTANPEKWIAARHCRCFENEPTAPPFHGELQDEQAEGWKLLVDLVAAAAAREAEEFAPFHEMDLTAMSEVITLPPTIANLKTVRWLRLTSSSLVRIPPEIGEMENLQRLDLYKSHRLHWMPYELTRCSRLAQSMVSTRCLYGNWKHRPGFPRLESPADSTDSMDLGNLAPSMFGAPTITTCSVCRAPLADRGLHQAWISLRVGTDVWPLLVNACSAACIAQLPPTPPDYVSGPHLGGPALRQPLPFREQHRTKELA